MLGCCSFLLFSTSQTWAVTDHPSLTVFLPVSFFSCSLSLSVKFLPLIFSLFLSSICPKHVKLQLNSFVQPLSYILSLDVFLTKEQCSPSLWFLHFDWLDRETYQVLCERTTTPELTKNSNTNCSGFYAGLYPSHRFPWSYYTNWINTFCFDQHTLHYAPRNFYY